jgi:hypothetical protein
LSMANVGWSSHRPSSYTSVQSQWRSE